MYSMRYQQSDLATRGLYPNDKGEAISASTSSEIHTKSRIRLPSSLCKPSLRAYFDWDDSGDKDYAKRPALLDLYAGGGGAAMGYYLAGFRVVGVDIKAQPHYPFEFYQADALTFPLEGFDAYHASPPCQDFIPTVTKKHGTGHFLPDIRQRLIATGKTWVIENIPGAPLRADFKLCGCMFDLPRLRRQRWFETSWNNELVLRSPCQHPEHPISVTGHGIPSANYYRDKLRGKEFLILAKIAMGINWMNRDELSQAIPPAYTEFIGRFLMRQINDTTKYE